ncbi:MAG: hypothetical protein ACRCVN_05735 [Spirochaetia bacterium]
MYTKTICTTILFSVLLSCNQKISLTLSEDLNNKISGKVESQLYLAPIFSRYLKNLDIFSGVELPKEALPTTIANSLLPYKNNQQNYTENTTFEKKSQSYNVDFSFQFSNINSLTESHIKSLISDVVSVDHQASKTTLRIEFNQKNRQIFEKTLPLLLPMPTERNDTTKRAYIRELAQIISETERQSTQAQKEISLSTVQIQITTPRPILLISGGKITNTEKTQALIEIDLSKVIFLEKNQLFLITY